MKTHAQIRTAGSSNMQRTHVSRQSKYHTQKKIVRHFIWDFFKLRLDENQYLLAFTKYLSTIRYCSAICKLLHFMLQKLVEEILNVIRRIHMHQILIDPARNSVVIIFQYILNNSGNIRWKDLKNGHLSKITDWSIQIYHLSIVCYNTASPNVFSARKP